MTNADKYLKDGVSIYNFCKEYEKYYEKSIDGVFDSLRKFLVEEVKPTLTEDERVILKNIEHPYKWIRRNHKGELQISDKDDCAGLKWYINFTCYQSLFLFIKQRRRIFDKGVVGG